MRSRSSLLPSLATVFAVALLLALAPTTASASEQCPCWDEIPPGPPCVFLFCYDSPGPQLNSFGYAPPNTLLPFVPAFYQVTDLWCRVNGNFIPLKSQDEADDCRWHLLEACGIGDGM